MAKPKITKSRAEQKINLRELFGVSLKDAPALKQAIGQKIIDRIVTRTESGRGIAFNDSGKATNLKLRSPYSKEYADSTEFKAAGKSRGDVNMTLTGDMLGLLDIIDVTDDTITIGWDDDEQIQKVHGHQTGKSGKVPKMKRPFFGVSKTELLKIKADMNSDVKQALKIKKEEPKSAFNDFVLGLLDDIESES